MKIFIGSDHRGFSLKNKLIEFLSSHFEIQDCGNLQLDPKDDYPDFAKAVANNVAKDNDSLGIVICGSGVGVCVSANKIAGIRCGLGFDTEQIKHARANDHINILALSSDYLDYEKNKEIVETYLNTQKEKDERFVRRINKL